MRGKLITLEGIDGSGKSTILKRLHRHFQDNPDVIFTREPTSGWIGEAVYRAIKSETDPLAELFLFIADHAHHLSTTIKPALEDHKIVISDRYSDSRYAYQGATLKGIIDHPLEWVMGLHKGWTVVPDLTILLDVNPATAITRVGNRDHQTKFEKIAFLEQVRSNYLKLVEKEPDRFLVVDAGLPIKEVEDIVLSAIAKQL
jgi:dTMP kinase